MTHSAFRPLYCRSEMRIALFPTVPKESARFTSSTSQPNQRDFSGDPNITTGYLPPVLREYHCPLCLSVKFAPMIIFATAAVEPQTDSGPVSETCRVEFGFSFHVKVLTEAFVDSVVYCSLVGILLVLTKGSRVMYSLTH